VTAAQDAGGLVLTIAEIRLGDDGVTSINDNTARDARPA
jgi:hypothetical protein